MLFHMIGYWLQMLIDVVLHDFMTQYDLISELQYVAPSLPTTSIVFPGPPEQGLSRAPKSCTKKAAVARGVKRRHLGR